MDIRVLAMMGLVAFSIAALLYGFLYGRIERQASAERRRTQVAAPSIDAERARAAAAPSARRRTVQDTLKDLEVKQKHKASKSTNPPMQLRLAQAGLNLPISRFYAYSALTGVVIMAVCFLAGLPLLLVLGAGFVGAVGLPRFVVNFIRKKRHAAFIDELANAVEVIVRGVKAGLPLNDCLRMIASEAKEPVKSEFRLVIEAMQLGMPIDEAVTRMYERVPLPETNFFGIVLAIQSKAGGNLSEALGNLAKVLRERKKMRAKIQAMSMEAKSSAAIIGSLPIIVTVLVYLTSPDYIMVLFVTPIGQIVVGISLLWMLVGIFIMKRMIAFDF
ncbi:pilus assembly protein [Pleomorphomonas diazotrophica]|uniref:Pilus assembly protein n=1 Tax=Pleomorphomonas diazotrophica TaxID=1166257 RepID=A0A1I4RRQ4_9HYPH|nr:type II secretion system F family protein [Pleomorphomonas diazotrophica]PKR88106.1 pilus assembly protein [Pleomorphomonas diazotrophica]SFM54673.1 tight adherence protein B [Pleomorphomonas diazotrophica]